jgi:hypothetical protein
MRSAVIKICASRSPSGVQRIGALIVTSAGTSPCRDRISSSRGAALMISGSPIGNRSV